MLSYTEWTFEVGISEKLVMIQCYRRKNGWDNYLSQVLKKKNEQILEKWDDSKEGFFYKDLVYGY